MTGGARDGGPPGGEAERFSEALGRGVRTLRGLGPLDVGASPRSVMLERGRATLYRYQPRVEAPRATPVLVVYALVNRPYMADLQEDRSLVRGLLERAQDVWLLDWGYPRSEDARLGLDDLVCGTLDACVDAVRQISGADRIHLLGICQGGTFSLCYAALQPEKLRTLTVMVTPVDFHTPDNQLRQWVRHLDVDLLVDVMGNVPGALLNQAFVGLRPLRLGGQKYLDMVHHLATPEGAANFLRMERWIQDSPDQPGEAFRQFVKWFYQENRLVRGRLELGGRMVDLASIRLPVLNLYATEDHIVPPSASLPLADHVSCADYTVHAFRGGHIGIYVSRRAQREVPALISSWLDERAS